MQKKLLKTLSALLLIGCTFTMASCNKGGENPSSTVTSETSSVASIENSQTTSSEETSEDSVIKSLVAKSEVVNARIGETSLITSYYSITGKSSLSAAQKKCTYETSNESIVKIVNTSMKAVGVGEATITVTSKVDTTKTCSFKVVVKDIFFSRETSSIQPDDDFDQELLEDGGIVRTKASFTGDYFINGIDSTTWMATTEITVNSVTPSEKFPKFGIVASTGSNAAEGGDNRLYFFLNAEIGNSENSSWNRFGVCEVFNGSSWAWNPGVGDTVARHNDGFYVLPNEDVITYATKFKVSMARDGFDFHMWVNDTYAGSMTIQEYLFTGFDGLTCNSSVGFFQFNSDVTFSGYSATSDATEVQAKISSIETKSYIESWTEDAN